MEINFDIFWEWAISKWGEENCIHRGAEICINSPFVPEYDADRGYHLYCNVEKGVYHCWKTDSAGSLYQLVMITEGCDFLEAKEIIGSDKSLYQLEKRILEFYTNKKKKPEPIQDTSKNLIELPKEALKITNLNDDNKLKILAEEYLKNRCISSNGLYICGSGLYANRIIIPYYGPNNQLIYFNSRDITGKSKLRYKGPPKEIGIGKSDVVWMSYFPPEGSNIYLTEGEFDAMSLCQIGLHGAAAGGKNFGDKQLALIRPYNITISFDLDKSGLEALNKVGIFMRSKQFVRGIENRISYVSPAKGYKDWNEMLCKLGANILQLYIKEKEKLLQWDDIMKLNS